MSKNPTSDVFFHQRKRVLDLTQAEMADLLTEFTGEQWSRDKVKRLESGDATVDVELLQTLSRLFELDYATLIDGYARRGTGDTRRLTGDAIAPGLINDLTSADARELVTA